MPDVSNNQEIFVAGRKWWAGGVGWTLLKWDIYLVLLSAIVVATLAGKWLWDK